MCGESNADMPFVADGTDQGKDYVTYNYTIGGLNDNWKYISKIFYFSTQEKQKEFFHNFKENAELPEGYFLTLNMYSEGEYYLDNIEVVKTTVAGITYYDYALRVDFGYEINHKELLANSATGVLEFDTNLAKVFNGDQELEVDAIELHSDGYLYIFTVDGGLSEADNGNITVSFTNPVDTESGIKYSTLKSPYPWGYEGVRNVYSFEGESAYADETISGIDPQKYLGPKLVSADRKSVV